MRSESAPLGVVTAVNGLLEVAAASVEGHNDLAVVVSADHVGLGTDSWSA